MPPAAVLKADFTEAGILTRVILLRVNFLDMYSASLLFMKRYSAKSALTGNTAGPDTDECARRAACILEDALSDVRG
jgi:hypothetical protein